MGKCFHKEKQRSIAHSQDKIDFHFLNISDFPLGARYHFTTQIEYFIENLNSKKSW